MHPAARDEPGGVAVAPRVADRRIEIEASARTLLDLPRHRAGRDQRGPRPGDAATGVGLQLERRKTHGVGMLDKEPHQSGELDEVTAVYRRIEHDGDAEPSRAPDIFPAQCVERLLVRVPLALLRVVYIEGDVHEPCA